MPRQREIDLMSFDGAYFFSLLFSTEFFKPAWIVLYSVVLSMILGVVIGTVCGILLQSPVRWTHPPIRAYVTVFRGVPVLVQLVMWYNGLSALTNGAITLPAITAGILALGVNEGAYMTEIVRSGISAVDRGQREAAQALNLSYAVMMRRVILPQAFRIAIPPTGNQVINLIKNTSLMFTISVPEIFSLGSTLYAASFKYFEVLSVVSLWYLLFTIVWSRIQKRIEAQLGRGGKTLFT